MQPVFRLESDSDLARVLNRRLLGVRIVDAAGIESDSVEITLDDRDNAVPIPDPGATISVWIGYQGHPRAELNGLAYMGRYAVGGVEFSGPPQRVSITARAADLTADIKAPRDWTYHDSTIGGVVGEIAARHGLVPLVDDTLAAIAVSHIDQVGESDLGVLRRLADQYDAVAKPIDGRLVFQEHAQRRLARGQVEVITLPRWGETDYRVTFGVRENYRGCVACWYDHDRATRCSEFYGTEGDGPVFRHRHDYQTQQEARDAAERELGRLARGAASARFTLPGNQRVRAETMIRVPTLAWGIQLQGDWLVTRVEHRISESGFTTAIDAETPGKVEGASAVSSQGD